MPYENRVAAIGGYPSQRVGIVTFDNMRRTFSSELPHPRGMAETNKSAKQANGLMPEWVGIRPNVCQF